MRVQGSSDISESVVGVDAEGVALVDLDGRRTAASREGRGQVKPSDKTERARRRRKGEEKGRGQK